MESLKFPSLDGRIPLAPRQIPLAFEAQGHLRHLGGVMGHWGQYATQPFADSCGHSLSFPPISFLQNLHSPSSIPKGVQMGSLK